METNPYAPPKAPVADVSPADLKPRSVVLMIVLSLVSFGLYVPIWFLRRRAALNRLDSPRKLRRWPFVFFIGCFVLQFLLAIASGPATPEQAFGAPAAAVLTLVQFAAGIVMLVQSFFTKQILEDHLAGPGDQVPNPLFVETVRLSGVMTFFFQIFYLQYVINRHITGLQSRAV